MDRCPVSVILEISQWLPVESAFSLSFTTRTAYDALHEHLEQYRQLPRSKRFLLVKQCAREGQLRYLLNHVLQKYPLSLFVVAECVGHFGTEADFDYFCGWLQDTFQSLDYMMVVAKAVGKFGNRTLAVKIRNTADARSIKRYVLEEAIVHDQETTFLDLYGHVTAEELRDIVDFIVLDTKRLPAWAKGHIMKRLDAENVIVHNVDARFALGLPEDPCPYPWNWRIAFQYQNTSLRTHLLENQNLESHDDLTDAVDGAVFAEDVVGLEVIRDKVAGCESAHFFDQCVIRAAVTFDKPDILAQYATYHKKYALIGLFWALRRNDAPLAEYFFNLCEDPNMAATNFFSAVQSVRLFDRLRCFYTPAEEELHYMLDSCQHDDEQFADYILLQCSASEWPLGNLHGYIIHSKVCMLAALLERKIITIDAIETEEDVLRKVYGKPFLSVTPVLRRFCSP